VTDADVADVETLEAPTLEAAVDVITAGLERETLVTVFGRCTVEYDGRTASHLEAGNRHLMLKPDGTALVHTQSGQKPVNWQPPGCSHQVQYADETLVVCTSRSSPKERLQVCFERILQLSAYGGGDESERTVEGTEADLKTRILERPDLLEPGFRPLATERQTTAGAIDIYGADDAGRTVVVELKRRRVGPDAVSQLRRYVDATERDLHADARVRGILVAPSVTDRADRLLADHGLEFVALEPAVDT